MLFFHKSWLNICLILNTCYVCAQTPYFKEKPTTPEIVADSVPKKVMGDVINRHFFWTGLGLGLYNPSFMRTVDEVNFAPKQSNHLFTIRLRLAYSLTYAGTPAAYTREVMAMYGKIYRHKRLMFTGSAGLCYMWGNRWIEELGTISSPPSNGLRRSWGTVPYYKTEEFSTVGLPIRTQAFLVAGKEFAFGISVGTTLNVKQIRGDVMAMFLLGIN